MSNDLETPILKLASILEAGYLPSVVYFMKILKSRTTRSAFRFSMTRKYIFKSLLAKNIQPQFLSNRYSKDTWKFVAMFHKKLCDIL